MTREPGEQTHQLYLGSAANIPGRSAMQEGTARASLSLPQARLWQSRGQVDAAAVSAPQLSTALRFCMASVRTLRDSSGFKAASCRSLKIRLYRRVTSPDSS
jgi:hypothetical protein